MAEQNKTVVIAVVAVLGLAVIGLGAWFFMSDSRPQPVVIDKPLSAATETQASAATEGEGNPKRSPRKTGDEEPPVEIDRVAMHKPIEAMTEQEIKERRGDTTRPGELMP